MVRLDKDGKPITHHIDPFVFAGDHEADALSRAAQNDPTQIDRFAASVVHESYFDPSIRDLVEEQTVRGGTPEIPNWPRDPGRPSNYYRVALCHATLLGRAFAILVSPPRSKVDQAFWDKLHNLPVELQDEIYAMYKVDLIQAYRLGRLIYEVFSNALMSAIEPEPAARYTAGILILTCSHALTKLSDLRGKGKDYVPWNGDYAEPDAIFTFEDVRQAIFETEKLPRDNTDGIECFHRAWEHGDYFEHPTDFHHISQETLDVYDCAREHLNGSREDWTSEQVMDKFLYGLNPEENETKGSGPP
ncbi:MAG: hypothetical protein M1828_007401 [Chrysothrix sp. TS-e1954]|nr:MAG: hypothetical protein M1828_007401 [Chrysothrix sp. TS-e1954]